MNIFYKRPLSLILCIGLGGFFCFTFDSVPHRVALIIFALLPLIILCFLKIDNSKKFICQTASAVLILSFLLSFLYFDKWFKAYEIYEDRVNVVGTVENYSMTNSYTKRLLIRVEEIDGKKISGYKFYAYIPSNDAKSIIYGTRICFDTDLTGFSKESRSYNISKGINAYASDVENIQILSYSSGGLQETLAYYREILARYTISISDADSGALLSALLLGERDYLPNQLRLDFKRIGISHILALSGMHLAILSLGIDKILTFFQVRKKARLVTVSLFVLLYMAITGFSVSVVRAGVMLIISSCLFLLGRTKDSLTSLSVAVFIICLFNPNAIYDISLQLSAFATLGIIVFSEFSQKHNLLPYQNIFLKYLVQSVLASIFAISSTLFISAFSFGGISVISPIATLIFSFIVEIVMNLGCIMMLLGAFIPIGKILSPICSFISYLAGTLSSKEIVYASTDFTLCKIAIIVYTILFFLFIFLKLKNAKKALYSLILAFAVVSIIPAVSTAMFDSVETVSYHAEQKSDQIIVRSNGEVCLIDSSQYSKSLAYDSIDFLEENKVTYLDKYYLTHYSWSLDDSFEILLANYIVEAIYLPMPRNEDEETILKLIYKETEDYRTEIYTVSNNEIITVGEYKIKLLYSAPYGETSMNAFTIVGNDKTYTYISSGMLTKDSGFYFDTVAKKSDCLIFGIHGKKYKDTVYLNYYSNIDKIIINSDNLILSDRVTDQYEEGMCEIIISPSNSVSMIK